ncbi:MAG: flagellar M-ring protein FliF C-terminal domain-containing protein [Candidatus Syntrophopropionicum ammoniitolerans]
MLAQIIGLNNAVAMVTADLDFDQKHTNSSIASNPDELKVSEYSVAESGTDADGGGVVGTDSNVTTTPFVRGRVLQVIPKRNIQSTIRLAHWRNQW